jgi:hypothetical protein
MLDHFAEDHDVERGVAVREPLREVDAAVDRDVRREKRFAPGFDLVVVA